jgi:mutator protein MutT
MEFTRVAVGILLNEHGHVFICQRNAQGKYPLKWEFPGGKAMQGEDILLALQREMKEELNIIIYPEFILLDHEEVVYEDGSGFSVSFFLIRNWQGEFTSELWHDTVWVLPEQLGGYDFLKGNLKFIEKLPAFIAQIS